MNMTSSKDINTFKRTILSYYKKSGRNFAWRKTHDPYKIWISETMLQQTGTARVISKYEEFLKNFPDLNSLAKAPLQKIFIVWKGLGYNSRALRLKHGAEFIINNYDGKFPKQRDLLLEIPGIGQSTAAAILNFSFKIPTPFIETNIRAVFIHFFFKDKQAVSDKEILPLIEKTLPQKNSREWFYALMDYGVYLKAHKLVPNSRSLHYKKQSPFKGSLREKRAKILAFVSNKKKANVDSLSKELSLSQKTILPIIKKMEKEGIFQIDNQKNVYIV